MDQFKIADFTSRTWAIVKADGKVVLTMPLIFLLGVGLVVTGLMIVGVGAYLILATTRGI